MLKKINNRYCLWSDETGDYVIDVEGGPFYVFSFLLISFFPKKGYELKNIKQKIIEPKGPKKTKLDLESYGGAILIMSITRVLFGHFVIENSLSRVLMLAFCFTLLFLVRFIFSNVQKKEMDSNVDYGKAVLFNMEYRNIKKSKRFVTALLSTVVIYVWEIVTIIIFTTSGDFMMFISCIILMVLILMLGQYVIPNSKDNRFGIYFIQNKK